MNYHPNISISFSVVIPGLNLHFATCGLSDLGYLLHVSILATETVYGDAAKV